MILYRTTQGVVLEHRGAHYAVPGGATYDYNFTVANRAATYWYHPHPHHLTGKQVYLGQAGLFIVDDPDGRFDASGREVRIGTHKVRIAAARGYNVAVWRQDEIVYSLVSDLDEDQLFQLVQTAQADAAH